MNNKPARLAINLKNRTVSRWGWAVAVSITLFVSPSASASASRISPGAAAAHTVSQQGNQFAIDLFQRVAAPPGNALVSPWSIRTALSLASAGAHGKTLAAMNKVLHLAPQATQHLGTKFLNELIQRRPGVTVTMANRLWVAKMFPIKPTFAWTAVNDYAGGISYADFTKPGFEVSRINAWVAKQTGGHIKDLLAPSDVNKDTALVLTNATYFKGTWTLPFDPARTRNDLFRVRTDYSVSTPMMHQKFKPVAESWKPSVRHEKRKNYELLELPYSSGHLALTILAPPLAVGGLSAFIQTLKASDFKPNAGRISEPLNVILPKFKFSKKVGLKRTLSAMGLKDLFSKGAEFGGMSYVPLWLGDVIHQAFIQLDETGTEAAAATAVTAVGGAAKPVTTVNVDRPFVFAIRDTRTGTLLYMGRMDDPTKR